MREIKFLGTFQKKGISRSYQYSIFECPACLKRTEKIRKDGLKAKGCCHTCSRKGNRRGAYKDKVMISGYYYIHQPDHPNATESKYVAEHRLIAEKKISRILRSYEVVHHINKDKLDNRPNNLEVMTASEHNRLHANERWRKKRGEFTI